MITRTLLLAGAVTPIAIATFVIILWWASLSGNPLSLETAVRVTSLGTLAGSVAIGLAAWMYRWAKGVSAKLDRLHQLASAPETETESLRIGEGVRDELDYVGDAIVGMKDISRRYAELSRSFEELREASNRTEELAQRLRHNEVRVADCLEQLGRAEKAMTHRTRAAAFGELFAGVCCDFSEQMEFVINAPRSEAGHARMMEAARELHRRMRLYAGLSSRRAPSVTSFALRELLDETVTVTEPRWRSQSLTNGTVFTLRTTCPADLHVKTDRFDLMEMLVHVIDNAVEAMHLGGVISLEAVKTDRGTVILTVRDQGDGMSDETLRACCKPFFSTREDAPGLGLAVVSSLARRNGIRFGLQSARGQGTSAILEMTAASGRASEPAMRSHPARPQLRPLLILAVDDNRQTTEMISDMLTGDGHVVDTCTDPSAAIVKLNSRRYDIALIDRAMPKMSGFELARLIKENRPDIPVVMLTGFADVMRHSGEIAREVDLLLGKPFDHDELVEAIALASGATAV